MNNWILLPVIVFMTMLGALGGFFFKRSSTGADSLLAVLKAPSLYLGGGLYVASALVNVWVLRFLPYSVVMPMTAVTYIWTMLLSRLRLGEKITRKKILGVALILAGAVLVALR